MYRKRQRQISCTIENSSICKTPLNYTQNSQKKRITTWLSRTMTTSCDTHLAKTSIIKVNINRKSCNKNHSKLQSLSVIHFDLNKELSLNAKTMNF